MSRTGDLLDLPAKDTVVEKSVRCVSCKDERPGQGRDSSKQFLRENRDLVIEIREGVLAFRAANPNAPLVKSKSE